MPDILPGYTFNPSTNQYRSNATGQFVSRRNIVALLDANVTAGENRLAALTIAAHDGRLSPSAFAEQFRTEIRRLHLQNASLGAGGWANMTQADYGRVGGKLTADYRRVEGFAQSIASGEISLAQALNRARLYAGNARTQYWQAVESRLTARPGMVQIERRQLGASEHCGDCVNYYERGWQPLGTLPSPGEGSECLTGCKCTKVYREVDILVVGEWLGTRR